MADVRYYLEMPQPYEIADLRIYYQLQRNVEVKKQVVQEPTSEYYSVVAEENVDKEPTRASVAITEDVEPSSGNRRKGGCSCKTVCIIVLPQLQVW